MDIASVYALIETNADLDGAVCIYGEDDPSNRRVSRDARFRIDASATKRKLAKKSLTVTFTPDDRGAIVTAGAILDCFNRSLTSGCEASWRCQIVIVGLDGEARGYLSDDLWSHMSVRERGCFSLNDPVDVSMLDRTWLDAVFDFFTTPNASGGI